MSPRLPFAGLFVCSLAAAQTVSFGVVGGASLTPDFGSRYSFGPLPPGPPIVLTDYSASQRYIAGGMLELKLPKNWSIEADAMYHPLRFDENHFNDNGSLHNVQPLPVVTWEFPVLAKYRFRGGSWRPFLEGGPTFRTAGNLNGTTPSHYGFAAGVGAETSLGRFHIAPEVRYVRWAEDSSLGQPVSRSDQVELLTSFSTGTFEGGRAFSQRVSVGVVVGATVTPDLRSVTFPYASGSFSSSPAAFLLGAMVEVAIARGVFIEGDAIHQPITPTFGGVAEGSINTWSFPLLGKYKFSTHGVKPFLEAGPAFRGAKALLGSSTYGVTAGVGIETHLWRIAIAPAVRYTHWGPNSSEFASFVPFQNQVAVLSGFSF